MSRRLVGLLLLLLISLGIGLVFGHWFYGLYERSIPEALKASTSMQGTYVVFLWRGGLLGVVVFAWSLVSVLLGRLLIQKGEERRDASPGPR